MYNPDMVLKPQDVVVVLKLLGYRGQRPSFAQMAKELAISSSEVHAAMKRAQAAGLLHGPELSNQAIEQALEEFLIHGVKYAFPVERGGPSRGVATAHAAKPLNQLIAPGDEPIPVWPYAKGESRGIAFAPFYKLQPVAALQDPLLYVELALIDAIRGGRARERRLAENELIKILRYTSNDSLQFTTARRRRKAAEAALR